MTAIKIDLDASDQFITLSGEIDKLLSNRRARYYFADLQGINSEKLIKIPFEEPLLEKTIERIRSILSNFDIVEELSDTVQKRLFRFLMEEKKFREFSSLAYSIREGQLSPKEKQDIEVFGRQVNASFPTRQLYPLQLLSAYHLAFSQNACNFSVPGAGKTSIVYAAYAYLKALPHDDPKHVNRLIIIGPLSSFGPWEKEFEECFGFLPSSKRLSGGTTVQDKIKHFYASSPAEISLISYQGLTGIIEHLENYLKKYPCMVVLDEAHKIKNVESGSFSITIISIEFTQILC